MSEARLISPMLDGFALGGAISSHCGVSCYPAMPNNSDERYIVKTISVPASQVQVEAMLLTGVFPNDAAAAAYFQELADGIRAEVEILDKLSGKRGFLPYEKYQIVPMEDGVGYEVYLLSRYTPTLERRLKREPLTHLSAVNLGIDMCAALAMCRNAGYLYVALKPENIFLTGPQEYLVGDLGFVSLDSLEFAALPDRYRSSYIPPEVSDAYSTLNSTMDTYALGLVLYQIYNDGKLPFATADERKALGGDLPAPANADADMAQIILKACALQPEDRWADPVEMGQALIAYMQLNGANDVPILPAQAEEPEDPPIEEETPVEEAPAVEPEEEAEPVVESEPVEEPAPEMEAEPTEEPVPEAEAEPAEEPVPEAEAEPAEEPAPEAEAEPAEEPVPEAEAEPVEEPVPEAEAEPAEEPVPEAEAEPAEEPAPEVEAEPVEEPAPEADWIDRMDAILSEEPTEEAPAGDEPSLRELMDDSAYADAGEVATGELSEETADMLNLAQELIEHETPAPVVAPEPIDVPIPEPITDEEPEEDAPESEISRTVDAIERAIGLDIPEEEPDEGDAPVATAAAPRNPRKVLGIVAIVAVVALLFAGACFFYNNYYLLPINDISFVPNGLELTVNIDADIDQSLLTVVCTDNYGNARKDKPENGVASFTDLQPGTQYIITLEVDGFHKLVNAVSGSYTTPAQTQVINLTAVTGSEDGSMFLSFDVEGNDCQDWTLTLAVDGEEGVQVVNFTGHSVTVPGLTVGTRYTCTLSAGEDCYMTGEYVTTHTASSVVVAEGLTVSGYSEGSITAAWNAPEGVSVESWTVRCYNDNGYDQIQQVNGTSATFTGVSEAEAYTIEVTAAGMSTSTRTFVTTNPVSITAVTPEYVDEQLVVTWSYDGGAPAGGWKVTYTVDSSDTVYELTTTEAKVVLTLLAPSSTYHFTVTSADGTTVTGSTSASLRIPETKSFSANKVNTNNVTVKLYPVPDKDGWTYKDLKNTAKTFTAGGSLAVMYKTSANVTSTDEQYTTVFVIRDSDGSLVSISSTTRAWSDMWTNGCCVEEVKGLPTEPGDYKLDIYLNGAKLTRQSFSIG